jgi:endonuclease G
MKRGRAILYLFVFTIVSISIALVIFVKEDISGFNYLPSYDPGALVTHNYYTLSYNEQHEQANWVAYMVDKKRLISVAERTDRFRSDDSISTGSAASADYYRSGFDRGHLAPAADMSFSDLAMEESFLYSNISPQLPGFNRGIWKKLEEEVRSEVLSSDSIYVFTGPVFSLSGESIGDNMVTIPTGFYKIVIGFNRKDIRVKCWLIPHHENLDQTGSYRVSVDYIESATGVDFFYYLPERLESRLEKQRY